MGIYGKYIENMQEFWKTSKNIKQIYKKTQNIETCAKIEPCTSTLEWAVRAPLGARGALWGCLSPLGSTDTLNRAASAHFCATGRSKRHSRKLFEKAVSVPQNL